MKRAKATTSRPAIVSTTALRRLLLANFCVRAKAVCALNTVVAPVARVIAASVECGRMLVSISLDAAAEANDGLEFPGVDEESLTRAVPSARQKASASSGSTRLHEGQRFIFCSASSQLTASKFELRK